MRIRWLRKALENPDDEARYIVPYRVRPRLRRIEILRVFHASRKRPKTW